MEKPKRKRKTMICPICDKVLCRKERMIMHMWNAHKVKYVEQEKLKPIEFECDQCGLKYRQKKGLSRHKKEKHIGYKCKECNEFVFDIDIHLQQVHNTERERPFQCEKCSKCFLSVANLKVHQKQNCFIKTSFTCRRCDEVFENEQIYRKHERMHKYERRKLRKSMCDICGKVMAKANLEAHTKSHSEEKRYQCEYCNDRFKALHTKILHQRRHTNERPFDCKICGKTFMDRSCLRVHYRCHTGENPYLCHLCGRRTKQAQNLASHYRHLHRNNEVTSKMIRYNAKVFARYSQEEIDNALSTEGDLSSLLAKGIIQYNAELEQKALEEKERALQIEQTFKNSRTKVTGSEVDTKEKKKQTFDCTECGKSFENQAWLRIHQRCHTGDIPYLCHMCGHKSVEAQDLLTHYKNFHAGVEISIKIIRTNSIVFSRFSQNELDGAIKLDGNLSGLLTKVIDGSDSDEEQEINGKDEHEEIEILEEEFEDIDYTIPDSVENNVKNDSDEEEEEEEEEVEISNGQVYHIEIKSELPEAEDNFQGMNAVFLTNVFEEPEEIENISDANDIKCETIEEPSDDVTFDDSWSEEYIEEEKPVSKSAQKKKKPKEESQHHSPKNENNEPKQEYIEESYCGICDKIFAHYDNWLNHMTKMHKNISVRKRKEFDPDRKAERKLKRREEKEAKIPKMKCFHNGCNAYYSVEHMIKKHSETDRPFECYLCRANFKKQSNLKGHMSTVHVKLKRQDICHICGYLSKSPRSMRVHVYNKHTFSEPFPCEVCNEQFQTPIALKNHSAVHSNVRKYQCSFCHAGFVTASGLKIHERMHTGEKPFECRFCGKNFTDKSTMIQHERLHTGERPYMCHMCDRRTVQPGNLKSHYRHFHKVVVKHVKMYQKVTDNDIIKILPGYSQFNG